jgi:GABA(A) receptor-associated protein
MYQERYSEIVRRDEAIRIRRKYPDRIPCIIQTIDTTLPLLTKIKYLLPANATITDMLTVVRKHIRIKPYEALFLTCRNRVLSASTLCAFLYETERDEDGFLYLYYTKEQTYG